MCSRYSTCSKLLFFIFTNLIQIKEKTHVPVTVRFLDYAINENIHMYCIHEWDVFLIYLLLWQTQKLSKKSLLSLEKKKLFPAWFLVKFVMLPARSFALVNWFACVPACMSTITHVSLTSLVLLRITSWIVAELVFKWAYRNMISLWYFFAKYSVFKLAFKFSK